MAKISAYPDGSTIQDTDQFVSRRAASNYSNLWSTFKSTLKTYFDTLYAVTAKGVTNGDTHDHSGGDGAQIAYANLSGLPTIPGLPQGFLFGLTLSNNAGDATNDIDIAAGKCRDSTDAADMTLASALTKRLDAAWAVGTNQGGLDTGSIANTTYFLWLIKRSDTGVVDVLFSASASAPTMPASYDYKRRIGAIVRSGAAILGFVQDGDKFMWKAPVADVAVTNPGTSAVTRTLTVPVGIRVEAVVAVLGVGQLAADNMGSIYLSDLSLTDSAPSASVLSFHEYSSAAAALQLGGLAQVFTNTAAQIRSRVQISAANSVLYINTNGWIDTRGRLA